MRRFWICALVVLCGGAYAAPARADGSLSLTVDPSAVAAPAEATLTAQGTFPTSDPQVAHYQVSYVVQPGVVCPASSSQASSPSLVAGGEPGDSFNGVTGIEAIQYPVGQYTVCAWAQAQDSGGSVLYDAAAASAPYTVQSPTYDLRVTAPHSVTVRHRVTFQVHAQTNSVANLSVTILRGGKCPPSMPFDAAQRLLWDGVDVEAGKPVDRTRRFKATKKGKYVACGYLLGVSERGHSTVAVARAPFTVRKR